jgi:hypothetical protein
VKRPDAVPLPHPRERCHKCNPFFALGFWSHFFSYKSCRFCTYNRRIVQVINIFVFFKYTDFQHLWDTFGPLSLEDNWGATWTEKKRLQSRKPILTAGGSIVLTTQHPLSAKSWH